MLLFVFGCKGKKKNLIRQIFFRFSLLSRLEIIGPEKAWI